MARPSAARMLVPNATAGATWPPRTWAGSAVPTSRPVRSCSSAMGVGLLPPTAGDPPDEHDHHADADDPGDVALGDGTDPAEREAARIGGVLEVAHVADDRVELVVVEHVVVEHRHLSRSDADRLRDLQLTHR